MDNLVHLADEVVDLVLTVAKVTTLDEVLELAWAEATSWVAELDWPKEVAGLLEVWSNGVDCDKLVSSSLIFIEFLLSWIKSSMQMMLRAN